MSRSACQSSMTVSRTRTMPNGRVVIAGAATGFSGAYRPPGLVEAAGARVDLAAVHGDVRAGDPRGPAGQQEGDHVRDFRQAAQAAERELGGHERGEVLGMLLTEGIP